MDTCHPRHMGSQSYKPTRDARQSQFLQESENIIKSKSMTCSPLHTEKEISLTHAMMPITCDLPRWSPMSSNLSRMRQRTMQTSNTSSVIFEDKDKEFARQSHLQASSASSEQQHWMPWGDKTKGEGGNKSHRCAPGIHISFLCQHCPFGRKTV